MEFSLDTESQYREEQIAKLGSVPIAVEQNTFTLAELWKHKDDVQRFIIPELIPDASVSVLIGEDGIGKTQIMTQLCLSIALKFKTFMTLPLQARHYRCGVVATEDSRQKFTQAIFKQAMHIKPDLKPEDVDIRFTEGSNFDTLDDLLAEITKLLKQAPFDLIVIDALSDLFTMIDGEINSNTHARKIINKLQNICNTYDTAIILIHHAAKSKIFEIKKSGSIFITKDSSQGAGAITQKPRTVLALSNHKESTSEDGKYYDNYLHVVKANLMGKEYMTNALKLQFNGHNLCHTLMSRVNIEQWENENAAQTQPAQHAGKIQTKDDSSIHSMFVEGNFLDNAKFGRKDLLDKIMGYYAVGKPTAEDIMGQLLTLSLVENHGGTYVKQGDAPF